MGLFIIEVWSLAQLGIIIFLILFFTISRWAIARSIKNHEEKKQKINKLLNDINDNPNELTPDVIHFFNQSIFALLFCMTEINKTKIDDLNWERTKKLLSEAVLKKQSIKLSSSKSWFKKYLTILCYELGFNIENEKTLLKFLKDDNLIISINAAMQIFKEQEPKSASINEMITTLSEGRRILQSTFATMLTSIPHENVNLIKGVFIERLNKEKNIYTRIFCYRVLNQLERSDKIDAFVEKDLLNENTDLTIITLKYVAHVAQANAIPILLKHLNDKRNEVRSTVVKLLGEIGDKSVVPYLKDKLNDPDWWVRINSGNSLLNLGVEGVAALNEVSPQDGRFAYETAQSCLKIHHYSKKE